MKGLGTKETAVPPLSLQKNLLTLSISHVEASQALPDSLSCMKLLQCPSNKFLLLLQHDTSSATKQDFIHTVDFETDRILFKQFSDHWIMLLVICEVDCLIYTLGWV